MVGLMRERAEELEAVFQRELNDSRGCRRFNSRSESRRAERANGKAKVRSIHYIEKLRAETNVLSLAEPERPCQRNIHIEEAVTASAVSRNGSVFAEAEKVRGVPSRRECDSSRAVSFEEYQPVCCRRAVGEIPVQVCVERNTERERLSRLRLEHRSQLPAAQQPRRSIARVLIERHIPNQRSREAMSHIEVRVPMFRLQIERVLRQDRRARDREHIRYVVERV